jgi:hypothetical protein
MKMECRLPEQELVQMFPPIIRGRYTSIIYFKVLRSRSKRN